MYTWKFPALVQDFLDVFSKTSGLLFFFLNLFIHFKRDRESEQGRDREREGERESQAGSALPAQSPTRGSNAQTARS